VDENQRLIAREKSSGNRFWLFLLLRCGIGESICQFNFRRGGFGYAFESETDAPTDYVAQTGEPETDSSRLQKSVVAACSTPSGFRRENTETIKTFKQT